MTFRSQPMDFVAGPLRYDYPDWEGIGQVSRLWVPDDETVGWLLRQNDDRLAWFSSCNPDSLGYYIRLDVDALLLEGRRAGRSVADVWDEARSYAFSTTPQDVSIPSLMAEIRAASASK